jgi:hypothetical protein
MQLDVSGGHVRKLLDFYVGRILFLGVIQNKAYCC